MPLQGNLRDFSATQLFNLVNLSKRSGTLTIFEGVPTGERDAMQNEKMAPGAERAKVAFNKGKLVAAQLLGQSNSLVAVLNKAGKLTDKQAKIIQDRAKNTSDKALAMLLINAKYVSQNDIVTSIRQNTVDIVHNLMTWNNGPFRLDEDVLPGNTQILIPIDLENIIIEGARRMREIDELNKHLPNLDMALRFPENPKEKFKGIHLSVEEWRVVSFVNPKNTMRQIGKANNMSDVEIRRVVYGLEQAGLVELVKPAGAEQKPKTRAEKRRQARQSKVEKAVVNRLIDRLKSL